MEGLILWHKTFGFCKVTGFDQGRRALTVRFCGTDRDAYYAFDSIKREFQHRALPLESYGSVKGRGTCRIIRVPAPTAGSEGAFKYGVRFDKTGDTAVVDEVALEPKAAHPEETLVSRLSTPDPHALWKVQAREKFLSSLIALHRETQGVEALAASRVALYPHQAFVAATVIADPSRRFILADEVGLGKTIEAGIVIHDLLADKPNARVLVLTPGSLCRQWLCELHMSFGGQDFRLADLRNPSDVKIAEWRRLICSIERATLVHSRQLLESTWDMVVVDEAHHLLWAPAAYSIVSKVSANSPGLLLLSAIPAREREDELLRLLQLLDAKRYAAGLTAAKRFAELYRAQSIIGRRLRILDRALAASEKGEGNLDDLEFGVKRLVESPVVTDDEDLTNSATEIATLTGDAAATKARALRDYVVDRYRLSRRIIKNRRTQLVANALVGEVPRQLEIVEYTPDAFESECWGALRNILASLAHSSANEVAKRLFCRLAFGSMAEPVCVYQLASEVASPESVTISDTRLGLLEAGFTYSQDLQDQVISETAAAIKAHVPVASAQLWLRACKAWIDAGEEGPRLLAFYKLISQCISRSEKILVFCGVPGGAAVLVEGLRARFGSDAVEAFAFDLSDARKEEAVRRFRQSARCSVLVSDETGGEGRNFQFADVLVHYDLPWSVAAIEQRIGRLDRIGRHSSVRSFVICNSGSIERDYVTCLASGFKVFSQSISGLEFMLREQEQKLIDCAALGEIEDAAKLAAEIAVAADDERRNDDAEALTDAASFRTGRKYLTEISQDLERRLEDGFISYFRSLARASSARQIVDDQDPNLRLWLLRPDEVRAEKLPGLDSTAGGEVAEHRGTCQRLVARERRGVEFFCVGNPLFDAVASVALDRLSGRVFGMSIRSNGCPPGSYLYMRARVLADTETLAGIVALNRRARAAFFGRRVAVTYPVGEKMPLEESSLEETIARALMGDVQASDLGAERVYELIGGTGVDWGAYLMEMQAPFLVEARRRVEERYGNYFASCLDSIERERGNLKRSPLDSNKEVDANLRRLEDAFRRWQPVPDVVGFVEVAV